MSKQYSYNLNSAFNYRSFCTEDSRHKQHYGVLLTNAVRKRALGIYTVKWVSKSKYNSEKIAHNSGMYISSLDKKCLANVCTSHLI